jgi:hypothetical protein
MAYLELVSAITSVVPSKSKVPSRTNLKQVVDPQSSTAIKLRPNTDKEELTSTSGTKALTLSFEMLITLPGLVPSSLHRGALHLLSGHCRLEANHMGTSKPI